jgi:hypothetical protein
LLILASAFAHGQTVRAFTRTQDVTRSTSPHPYPVTFSQGETLNFTLTFLTTNQSGCAASVFLGSNDNQGGQVLIATGAVSGATASLSSAGIANTLPATNGWLWAEAWQQPGTNFLGVLWRARCTILNRGTP